MCSQCGFSGFVSAFNKKTGSLYAFRSLCSIADERNISLKIPMWSDARLKDYSLEPVKLEEKQAPPSVKIEPEKLTEAEKPATVKKDFKVLAADPHAYDEDDLPFN